MKTSSQRPLNRIGVRKKLLFATIITLLFFAVVEGACTLIGVGKAVDDSDPLVGFSSQIPLFEVVKAEDGSQNYRTAQNKLIWFNDQQFPVKKPEKTRRVFCLGGSTTFGRPYADSTSFCGWLREYLPLADDSTDWEVINAGGVSYASYRVTSVMKELAQYEPDLFVVYTGQNEFLERRTYAGMFEQPSWQIDAMSALSRTRTWSLVSRVVGKFKDTSKDVEKANILPGEVDEMLNHTIGPADYHRDDDWREGVLHHYRANLERMISIANDVDAAILFVVPASNERNCSPFKSELLSSLADGEKQRFTELISDASDLAAAGDNTQAIAKLNQAKQIDPEHAALNFRLGQLHYDSGSLGDAKEAFKHSLDNDVCPLRVPSDFVEALMDVTRSNDVPLVDFPGRLRDQAQTEHGTTILGEEYFLDHVHPTIEANRQLGLWIIEELAARSVISQKPIGQDEIDSVRQRVLDEIDPFEQAVALRNLAKVLHWAGKFEEALPRAREVLDVIPEDAESLLIMADCLRQTDQVEAALMQYEILLETSPMYVRGYLPFGELLFDVKKFDEARDVLTMATMTLPVDSPQQTRAQYFLALSYVMLNKDDKAIAMFEDISESYPDDPEAMYFLAQAYSRKGDNDKAIALYRRVLQITPGDAQTRRELSELLKVDASPSAEASGDQSGDQSEPRSQG